MKTRPRHRLIAIAAIVFAQVLAHSAAAETVVQLTYPKYPCKSIARYADETADMGNRLRVGGVKLSVGTFTYAVCEYAREKLIAALDARAKNLQQEMDAEALHRIGMVNKNFVKWLEDFSGYTALPDSVKAKTDKAQYLRNWISDPSRTVEQIVHHFLETNASTVYAALRNFNDESSTQILDGLQDLWKTTKERLEGLNKAYDDIEKVPDQEYADVLTKHGLSGSWITKLRRLEAEIRMVNSSYGITSTAKLMNKAFGKDTYGGKLQGMFDMFEQLGHWLGDSNAPGAMLIGNLVEAYAQLAKETLEQALKLEKLIREREGMCIGLGAHALLDERSLALRRVAGSGVQACPIDTKIPFLADVYEQTDPANANQLYFWTGKRMIKGREDGGGMDGVRAAQDFIVEAAKKGFSEFAGEEATVATVAEIYNVLFTEEDGIADLPGHTFRPGLAGLRAEAEAVVHEMASRLKGMRNIFAPDAACPDDAFQRLVEQETGLRAEPFPVDNTDAQAKLAISYALGYIQMHAKEFPAGSGRITAYSIYHDAWIRLASLSLVRLDGIVFKKGAPGVACKACAGVSVNLRVDRGTELAACLVSKADEQGHFTGRILTRSKLISIAGSATAGAVTSEPVTIGPDKLVPNNDATYFFTRKDIELALALSDGSKTDVLDATLAALRALHGQAGTAAATAREACAQAAALLKQADGLSGELTSLLAPLSAQVADGGQAVSQLATFGSESELSEGHARTAAESAGQARQDALDAANEACQSAELVRAAPASVQTVQIMQAIGSKVQLARQKADAADQARRAAADAARTAQAAANGAAPLADKILQLRTAATKARNLRDQLAAVEQSAKDAFNRAHAAGSQLGTYASRAKILTAQVHAIAAKSDATPEARAAGPEASGILAAIQAWLAEAKSCLAGLGPIPRPSSPDNDPGAVLAKLETVAATPDPAKSAATISERAKAAAASRDVAEVMAEGARSEAANAETCRALAAAALTGGREDDLMHAADAAIAHCKFIEAKQAIDSMEAGPRKAALSARYEAAMARESATSAMFEDARALFKAGDAKAALARLAEARANTVCNDYAAKIDATTAHIQSGLAAGLAEQVRAAIAQCQFDEAKALLDGAANANDLAVAALRAEYDSAYDHEKQTSALWQQANALQASGRSKEALALLKKAQSITRCKEYGARIAAAIAQLMGPPSETGDMRWQTPWRGSLKTQRILVNGSPVPLATLFAMMDRDWAAEKGRGASSGGSVSGIFKGLKAEIGDVVIGVVKMLAGVMDEGLPWGFALRPEGSGLRLAVVGDDKAAAEINKSLSALPPFTVAADRELTLSHRAAENGAMARATVVANEEWTEVTLTAVITSALSPGEVTEVRSIRTVELTFGGAFAPGEISAAEIQAELARKMEEVGRRYMPRAGSAR